VVLVALGWFWRREKELKFEGRWSANELILLCIRWYMACPPTDRSRDYMMAERDVEVDHSGVNRSVASDPPESKKYVRKRLKRARDQQAEHF
jgi:transposase-like protein